MVSYKIPGNLPAGWEDFLGLNGAVNVTIMSLAYLKSNNHCDEVEAEGIHETGDGWVDVVINVPAVTLEVAKEWLAVVNNVRVEDISIQEEKYCFSM